MVMFKLRKRFPASQRNPPLLKPCASMAAIVMARIIAVVTWVVAMAVTMVDMDMVADTHLATEDTGHMGFPEKLPEKLNHTDLSHVGS